MEKTHMKKVWILEQSNSPLTVGKAEGDSKSYILEGPCAYFGVVNDNERLYDKDDYLPHLKYLNAQIQEGCLLGSSDHNEDFQVSMKDVSHVIRKLWYNEEKKEVWIRIELVDTINGNGKDIMALVDKGVPIFISSRATGYMDDNGKVTIDTIYTYDIVYRPGFRRAKLNRITEGLKQYSKNIAIYEWKESADSKEQINTQEITPNPSEMEEYVKQDDFKTFAKNTNESFKRMEKLLLESKNIPSIKANSTESVIPAGKTSFVNESKSARNINESSAEELEEKIEEIFDGSPGNLNTEFLKFIAEFPTEKRAGVVRKAAGWCKENSDMTSVSLSSGDSIKNQLEEFGLPVEKAVSIIQRAGKEKLIFILQDGNDGNIYTTIASISDPKQMVEISGAVEENLKATAKASKKISEALEDMEALKNNYVSSGYKIFKTTAMNYDNVYDCYYLAKEACQKTDMSIPTGEGCYTLLCKFNKEKTAELELKQEVEMENVEVTLDDFLAILNNVQQKDQVFDFLASILSSNADPAYQAPEVYESEEEEAIAQGNKEANEFSKEKFDQISEQNIALKNQVASLNRVNEVLVAKLNDVIGRVNLLTENAQVSNKHILRLEEAADMTIQRTNLLTENAEVSNKHLARVEESVENITEKTELLYENAKVSNKHILRLEEAHDITAETVNQISSEMEDGEEKPATQTAEPAPKEAKEVFESINKKRIADKVSKAKVSYPFLKGISESMVLQFDSLDEIKKERVSELIKESRIVNDSSLISAMAAAETDSDVIVLSHMPKSVKPIWEKLSKAEKNSVISLYRYRGINNEIEAEVFWETLDLGQRVGRIDESLSSQAGTADILGYGDEDIKI